MVHSAGTTNGYIVSVTTSGGGLLFNNSPAGNSDIHCGTVYCSTGTLYSHADPAVGGTVVQTITPYNDSDNIVGFSPGDCPGDPITITYVAFPANPTFSFTGNGDSSVGNDSVNVSICTGGNCTSRSIRNKQPFGSIPRGAHGFSRLVVWRFSYW